MHKILYWSNNYKPQDFINNPHPNAYKIVKFLKSFDIRKCYKGSAYCRICGDRLGSSCFIKNGLQWPSKAEHYITEHNLWIPEFDEIIK